MSATSVKPAISASDVEPLLEAIPPLHDSCHVSVAPPRVVHTSGASGSPAERWADDLDAATHDFRAPLLAIRSLTKLLTVSDRSDSNDLAAQIESAAALLEARIAAFERYARIDSTPFEPRTVDLGSLCQRAIAMLSRKWPVMPRMTVEPLPCVSGDPATLLEMLRELLDNAIKFSLFAEAPSVTVGFADLGGQAKFFVRDNGVGIDATTRGRLFRLFKRAHKDPRFEGIGAGLAICRRVIERHGGAIGHDAPDPCGTNIWFTLASSPGTAA